MRLAQIEHFLAAVEAGSLRAGARRAGISQPAMTKSLRQLEAELHVRLLERNARGTALTAAGRTFLARASVIRTELRKTQDDLDAFRGGAQGAVAFGAAPQGSMLIVPEALQQFRRRFPQARVRVVEGVPTALLPLVRDETLDFCIGMRPAHGLDPALRFRPLYKQQLIVAARRGHPLAGATSLAQLAGAQWLMFFPPGSGAMLEKAFAAAGTPMPQGIVQCESFATALSILAKTDCLGLVIPQVLHDSFVSRALQAIRVKEEIPSPLAGMYVRADAPLTPAAAAMAQAVTAVARRLARER
ncbi:MAG: LysR substrate-binding domain-containing protein [Clostridia bacterium]